MNYEVIVTCAVTGAGDTVGKHPAIPVTPKEIAAAAIEAAKAGATVAHCHVRDPQTGKPSRNVALYREAVSYTHLDVYKRQLRSSHRGRRIRSSAHGSCAGRS